MIPANELRIGNLVQGEKLSIPREGISSDGIMAITANGIFHIAENRLSVDPIPLTREWFAKLGCPLQRMKQHTFRVELNHPIGSQASSLDNIYRLHPSKETIPASISVMNREGINDPSKMEFKILRHLYFVHHLQNVMFTLTGRELVYAG